jgi:type VI secretion system protein ImpA
VIGGRSKDLEIAAWLTEALLRSDGLVGLAAGSRLMTGLAENYWDELYPMPDEDGLETRIAPVAGLNGSGAEGTLLQPLRKLPLCMRPGGEPLFFWQYEQSVEVAGIGDAVRRQQRLDAGVLPFETVETEARLAGKDFAVLRRQAEDAAVAWTALGRSMDQRAGADGPPTSAVAELLEKIRAVGARFASEEPPVESDLPAATGASFDGAADGAVAVAVTTGGGLGSREEALRTLSQVADFFRRTEPHSPLAYTLQEAVRRGRLSWPDLLAEIVPDVGTRSSILISLGIKPPPEE